MTTNDPTRRFADRVADYDRARPDYPAGVLDLAARLAPGAGAVVADVGSGTGIFSRQLLERGFHVVAVEPNAEMRAVAEAQLGSHPGFSSLDGRAEATGLPDASVDLVTAAQAFHWFDAAASAREFRRILRGTGRALLVWNITRWEGTPFADGLGGIIREFNTDLDQIDHRRLSRNEHAALEFFDPDTSGVERFAHARMVNLEDLISGVASASYMPGRDDARFPAMRDALRTLFARHEVGGTVRIEYDTHAMFGIPQASS